MGEAQARSFGFYDMFCGIGAFHLAASKYGGECVGACDIDKFVRQTYLENFSKVPEKDVRQLKRLPEGTEWLFAGFPCPTFSLAGKSKLRSLGREDGLDEEERGQLIFEVERLVAATDPMPEMIVLENVKHLLHHDGGQTFEVVLDLFRDLGYEAEHALLNALDFGSPQNRERVFIVLFRDGVPNGFELPESNGAERPLLSEIVDPDDEVPDKYTVGPGTWDTLVRHKEYHRQQGNGFGYRLLDPNDPDETIPTISARYHKDGAEALIEAPSRPRPRRMTPREIARAFGFSDEFKFPVSDTQSYRQLGNSIVVPVAEAVVGAVADVLYPEKTGTVEEGITEESVVV